MMMMMKNPQQQAVYSCCQCALLLTYQTCLLVFLTYHQPNCRTKFLSCGNICMLQVLCICNTKLQSSITLMRNVRVVKMQIVCVCVCVCVKKYTHEPFSVCMLLYYCAVFQGWELAHIELLFSNDANLKLSSCLPNYKFLLTYLPTFTRLSTPQ